MIVIIAAPLLANNYYTTIVMDSNTWNNSNKYQRCATIEAKYHLGRD